MPNETLLSKKLGTLSFLRTHFKETPPADELTRLHGTRGQASPSLLTPGRSPLLRSRSLPNSQTPILSQGS